MGGVGRKMAMRRRGRGERESRGVKALGRVCGRHI